MALSPLGQLPAAGAASPTPRNAATAGPSAAVSQVIPLTVWRPSTGTWFVRGGVPVPYGTSTDRPLTADFTGDGQPDIAVFRPSDGGWYIRGSSPVPYGRAGDRTVPADFTGDGRADIAVWRPGTGTWYVRGSAPVAYGSPGDLPVPADFTGDGRADIAVFRPSTGVWYVKGIGAVPYGSPGDRPVASDFNGDGRAEIAVWRPTTGTWYIRGITSVAWGRTADQPMPAELTGDQQADVAVWRPSNGTWYVRGGAVTPYGEHGDVPIALPYVRRAHGASTLFGALVAPRSGESFQQAIDRQDTAYGRMAISRVFYDGGVQPWSAGAALSGRPTIVSFYYPPAEVLSGAHDAALLDWFGSAPRSYDVFWSYKHEPENDIAHGDFSAADYRAAWVRIAGLAARVGNPHLRSTLILMCFTLNPTAHRDWRDYYAGATAVSTVGFDCYNHGFHQDAYGRPSDLFGDVLTWAASTRIPWGISEVGSVKVASDPSGAGRAAWLRGVGGLLAGRAMFVSYFDIARRTDYALTDTPSRLAWREIVTTY